MKSTTPTPNSRIAIFTTNHALLRIACFSFGIFVIAVIIGALESGALSLLGDGAAMGVDVITYLANMYAEYKAQNGISNQAKWIFRVIIPSFALCSLLAVTGWITSDAVALLVSPSVDSDEDLDVSFLWGFATANIFVDALCTAAFYIRGRSVFYQEIKGALFRREEHHIPTLSLEESGVDDSQVEPVKDVVTDSNIIIESYTRLETVDDAKSVASVKEVNLNMLSAFTHISADTLRTITIFIAAAVTTSTNIRADVVDAYAAIIVTAIIICICFPLGYEIFKASRQILIENSQTTIDTVN